MTWHVTGVADGTECGATCIRLSAQWATCPRSPAAPACSRPGCSVAASPARCSAPVVAAGADSYGKLAIGSFGPDSAALVAIWTSMPYQPPLKVLFGKYVVTLGGWAELVPPTKNPCWPLP